MVIEAGRMVGGSLRLLQQVGRGAMGQVWVADHLGLRSRVAVKFMAQATLADPVSLQRFQQEATAAAEIRSPHVVRVFDHGTTEDGVPYIVMELLEGESLERRLKRSGPLAPAEVASVVAQCCKALAKAHERGIIHRDLKPGNVFLGPEDEPFVKLLDFGVAKFSGQEAIEMTAQGHMVGTPAYMSPEQLFHGKTVDHRGDLWSLAVVAYQSLTGQRPFEGLTLGELCVAIKRGEFTPPSRQRAGLPSTLDAWFGRAFARDLPHRFQSARELASTFDAACGGTGLTSSTPSLAAPPPRPSSSGAGHREPHEILAALASGDAVAADAATATARGRWVGVAVALGVALVGAAAFTLLRAGVEGGSHTDVASSASAPSASSSSSVSPPGLSPAGEPPPSEPLLAGGRAAGGLEAPATATGTATVPPSVPTPQPPSPKANAASMVSAHPRETEPTARPAATVAPGTPDDSDERARRAAEKLGL